MSGSGGQQSQQGSPDTSSSLLLPSAPLETYWGSPRREMQSHQVGLGLPLSSLSWTPFPGGQTPEHVCVVRADAAPLWALPTRLGCSPRLLDEHSPLEFTILITSLSLERKGKVVKTFSLVNWELRLAAQLCLYNVQQEFFWAWNEGYEAN